MAAARVTLRPVSLDEDRRWMARVQAYEVAGELWPVTVEVRLKPTPCWHDVEPADQDPDIDWERSDSCDHWPDHLWPGVENVPAGGLPVRLLKNLRLGRLFGSYTEAVANLRRYVGTDHPDPRVTRHYRTITEAGQRPGKQRGRPRADPRLHLQRLAALDASYAGGLPQKAAARRLGIAPQTLRVSLEWARRQEPPVWTRSGRGRPGRLTPHGRALIEEMQGT